MVTLTCVVYLLFAPQDRSKKILHAKSDEKIAGMAILISVKTDSKSKFVTRGKGRYILKKG